MHKVAQRETPHHLMGTTTLSNPSMATISRSAITYQHLASFSRSTVIAEQQLQLLIERTSGTPFLVLTGIINHSLLILHPGVCPVQCVQCKSNRYHRLRSVPFRRWVRSFRAIRHLKRIRAYQPRALAEGIQRFWTIMVTFPC